MELTDADLIRRHRAGDANALPTIMHRHAGWMTAVARRRMRGGTALADDVVQAVFIALANDAERVRTDRPLAGWLYRAVHLAAAHAARTEARRRRHEQEAAMQPRSDAAPPDDETIAEIEAAIATLRPAFRDAILLRFYERRSLGDAATAASISPEAFRKRLVRALDALRDRLVGRRIAMPAIALEATLSSPDLLSSTPSATATSATAKALAVELSRVLKARSFVPLGGTAVAALAAGAIAIGVAATSRTPGTPVATTVLATAPASDAEATERANEQLYRIRTATLTNTSAQWAEAVLALIELGPPAVPAIVAELDRTNRDLELRVLPIALRGIGDRRAVPALIRALPRTATNTSDFGLSMPREVATRLMPHLISAASDERFDTQQSLSVSVGRAVREVSTSLELLVGTSIAEPEEAFREPSGKGWTADRVKAFRAELAGHWQTAWSRRPESANGLPIATTSPADDAVARAGEALFGPLFPTGGRLGPVRRAEMEVQGRVDSAAFFDFESGRTIEPSEGVDAVYSSAAADDFLAWSDSLGVDMMMTQLIYPARPSNSKSLIRTGELDDRRVATPDTFSMRLWRVDATRWEAFDREIAGNDPIDPGSAGPAASFQAADTAGQSVEFDRGSKTYLFITTDGARGIVRFGDASATRRSFEYRLIEFAGIGPATQSARRPWAPTRPVRFAPAQTFTLGTPERGNAVLISLRTGEPVVVPPTIAAAKDDDARDRWIREQGPALVASFVYDRATFGYLDVRSASKSRVRTEAWSEASSERVIELAHRSPIRGPRETSAIMPVVPTLPDETGVACVTTAAGDAAIVRIVATDPAERTIRVELKRVILSP